MPEDEDETGRMARADDGRRTVGEDACSAPDERVAERVRSEHADFLDAVAAAARVTAESWGEDAEVAASPIASPATGSRDAVVGPFERVLRETGTLDVATTVLADAVDAAAGSLRADPVPDPPYVAVTSRGLVLRATTDVGRVVVTVAPFAVERDPVRYRLRDVDPDEFVEAAVHDAT